MARNLWFFGALMALAGFIGTAAGKIGAGLLPTGHRAYPFLATALQPTLGPLNIDLVLLQFSLSLSLHLNLAGLLAMIIAAFHFARRW